MSEDFRDGSLDRSRPGVLWIEALQEAVRAERVHHCSSAWLVASPVAIQVRRGYHLVSVRWIYLLVDFGDLDLESLTVAHFWKKLVGFSLETAQCLHSLLPAGMHHIKSLLG